MKEIPVACTTSFPDGRRCQSFYNDHVHTPTPCKNGQDERHHHFRPPKTITVSIAGHRKRIAVPA